MLCTWILFFFFQSSNWRRAVRLPPQHNSVMTDCVIISLLQSLQCDVVVVHDTWFMHLIVLILKYALVSHFRAEVRGHLNMNMTCQGKKREICIPTGVHR